MRQIFHSPVSVVFIVVLFASALTGCSSVMTIAHDEDQLYVPEKNHSRDRLGRRETFVPTSWSGSMEDCPASGSTDFLAPPSKRKHLPAGKIPQYINLSKGDVINLTVRDGSEFDGDYVVGQDGRINVPYIGRLRAAGKSIGWLEKQIRFRLVKKSIFQKGFDGVSVRIITYAPVEVSVTGAVFFPGFVVINEKNPKVLPRRTFGDHALKRKLTYALKGAYGVRPDADLSSVLLKRRGKIYQINMQGVLTGRPVNDPVLEQGDEVLVPTTGCFQTALVRPSTITPKGIRIYVSKMARGQGPDARYDEKLPYGIRLLRAAIVASCVGGSTATNGRRHVVLVSNNPVTKKTEVIQRSVEDLIRRSHRDEINPVLMPDDGIACYDSNFTEILNFVSYFDDIVGKARSITNN